MREGRSRGGEEISGAYLPTMAIYWAHWPLVRGRGIVATRSRGGLALAVHGRPLNSGRAFGPVGVLQS